MSDLPIKPSRSIRRSIRRQQRRRFLLRLDALVTMGLAGVLLVMINFLSFRYHWRTDVSATQYYSLSDQTVQLTETMDQPVDVYLIMQKDHDAYEDVARILREYASLNTLMNVRIVDALRDFSLTEELRTRYDVDAGGVVLIVVGDKRRILSGEEFYVDQESGLNDTTLLRSFRGEQLITSALHELLQGDALKVYFTQGHGEHQLDDVETPYGYAGIARVMQQENISAVPLLLGDGEGIPVDIDALVVAGPRKSISSLEIDRIQEYLSEGGRVMLLLDSGRDGGLKSFAKEWGVDLRNDVVLDATRTLTGKELFILTDEDHPITKPLAGLTSVFYLPRSVLPVDRDHIGAPLNTSGLRYVPIAFCSESGWAESNLEESPANFSPLHDVPGPVPVAATVEKAVPSSVDAQLRSSRVVVFGDSDFVSAAGMNGGDVDLFMNSLNWLLEREPMMSIRPREIETVKLVLDREDTQRFMVLVGAGLPTVVAVMGLLVWLVRRRS